MNTLAEARKEWTAFQAGGTTPKRHAEVAAIVIDQIEQDLNAEIAAILDDWFTQYRRAGRLDATMDEDMFLALRNRLIPLEPGDAVQFQEQGQRRWRNGTYTGPVDNPDDPRRSGDVVVLTRNGWHITVFLSSVRRVT